jgi:AraC-like DNA-binding protein
VDDLDHILSGFYVDGEVGARCGLFSPWDMPSEERVDASFHVVVSGRCWLSAPKLEMQARLEEGDLLIMPRGDAVVFADAPDHDRQALRHFRDPAGRGRCRFLGPGGSEAAQLLCGYFRFNGDHPFAAMLPPFIHVRAGESRDIHRLRATIDFMIEETASPRFGGRTVLRRLVELLFIQGFRAYASQAGASVGFLAALREDKQVARTLKAIHEHPEYPWTVDRLAHEAARSRTAFLARFAGLVGQPPLRYLTSLRMSRAKQLLLTGPGSLERVAEDVGYGSVQAFTRAFKRSFGMTPAEFRGRERISKRFELEMRTTNDDRCAERTRTTAHRAMSTV